MSVPDAVSANVSPAPASTPDRKIPATPLGFRHWAGPTAGLSAGLLALFIHALDPKTDFLLVALTVLGALNAYLLTIHAPLVRIRVISALAVALVLGASAFLLTSMTSWTPPREDFLPDQFIRPLIIAGACIITGASPVVMALLFMPEKRKSTFARIILSMFAGFLSGLACLVSFGMFDTLLTGIPDAAPALALACGNYLLFRLQWSCLGDIHPFISPLENCLMDAARKNEEKPG